jgi:hypothetical protein
MQERSDVFRWQNRPILDVSGQSPVKQPCSKSGRHPEREQSLSSSRVAVMEQHGRDES